MVDFIKFQNLNFEKLTPDFGSELVGYTHLVDQVVQLHILDVVFFLPVACMHQLPNILIVDEA
jgi:large-conductance mechanosensitive channel